MNTIIQTPTGKLETSLEFYRNLEFRTLSADPHIVTDGKAVIMINPRRSARAGVKFYRDSWSDVLGQLEEITHVTRVEDGYFFSDPSGSWYYLMESASPVRFALEEKSGSVLGNYMGLSLETTDMKRSIRILEILGFTHQSGAVDQGWITYANEDGFIISLLVPPCPHLFFNPSMTYFNGKNNLAVIEKIRALPIPIVEEITLFNKEGIVDNIIIRDPGGYGFFIFSD